MIDLKEIEERVILAAVSTQDGTDAAASLDELEDLARTAGAVCTITCLDGSARAARTSST